MDGDDILESVKRDYMPGSIVDTNRSGGINLSKKPSINEYHASPPLSPHVEYVEPTLLSHDFSSPREMEDSLGNDMFSDNDNGMPPLYGEHYKDPSTNTVTTNNNTDNKTVTTLFHIVSILCALISLFTLFPLFELIPACIVVCIRFDLYSTTKNSFWLHIINFAITIVVFVLFVVVIFAVAVFTYGLGFLLLIFLIPMGFVLIALAVYWPRALANQELL